MQDIQEKLRRKRQEPSFCLKIKADMACQSFQERNLWMRPSNKVWFEMLNSVILKETEGEITPLDTTMYQAVSDQYPLLDLLMDRNMFGSLRPIMHMPGMDF